MSRILVVASLASSLTNFRGPLLELLIRKKNEVYVAAPFDDPLDLDAIPAEVKPITIPIFRGSLNPLKDLATLLALYRNICSVKPEWILSYTIKPVIWAGVAGILSGVPHRAALITGLGYAFTESAAGKRAVIQWVAKLLYRISLAGCKVVFFQNPDDRDLFLKLGLLKNVNNIVLVNGSGVDLKKFSQSPVPAIKNSPRFLLIARLLLDKGIKEYVEASRLVRLKFPSAEFHLVGDVDANPNSITQEEVETWHHQGDIIWHGHQKDVRPFLTSCHVYVLPSYREGTPRSVLEAMATGRPIITTDAPGCRETVIDGQNGYLVPVKNAQALAQAMLRFCEQPELIAPMAEASLRIARDKYDVHKVNAVMLKAMGL